MGVVEDYTNRAIAISKDNTHGYSQANRWGPDYDCSSLVCQVVQDAGIPVKEHGASYTGNMRQAFMECGFKNVTSSCNLATGDGMQFGDILLKDHDDRTGHTAIYIGNGQLVHARSSEGNSLQGDQSGNEIRTQAYYNGPWDVIFRYDGDVAKEETVVTATQETKDVRCYELRLPYIRKGSMGDAVRAVQLQLSAQGYFIGPDGADGEFGLLTESAIKEYQRDAGLVADGVVGPDTGARLFGAEVFKTEKSEAKQVDKAEEAGEEVRPETFWNNLLNKIKK